jgi:hypothetical protein
LVGASSVDGVQISASASRQDATEFLVASLRSMLGRRLGDDIWAWATRQTTFISRGFGDLTVTTNGAPPQNMDLDIQAG